MALKPWVLSRHHQLSELNHNINTKIYEINMLCQGKGETRNNTPNAKSKQPK